MKLFKIFLVISSINIGHKFTYVYDLSICDSKYTSEVFVEPQNFSILIISYMYDAS